MVNHRDQVEVEELKKGKVTCIEDHIFNVPKGLKVDHKISILFDYNKTIKEKPKPPKVEGSLKTVAKLMKQRCSDKKIYPLQSLDDAFIFINEENIKEVEKARKEAEKEAKEKGKPKNIVHKFEVTPYFLVSAEKGTSFLNSKDLDTVDHDGNLVDGKHDHLHLSEDDESKDVILQSLDSEISLLKSVELSKSKHRHNFEIGPKIHFRNPRNVLSRNGNQFSNLLQNKPNALGSTVGDNKQQPIKVSPKQETEKSSVLLRRPESRVKTVDLKMEPSVELIKPKGLEVFQQTIKVSAKEETEKSGFSLRRPQTRVKTVDLKMEPSVELIKPKGLEVFLNRSKSDRKSSDLTESWLDSEISPAAPTTQCIFNTPVSSTISIEISEESLPPQTDSPEKKMPESLKEENETKEENFIDCIGDCKDEDHPFDWKKSTSEGHGSNRSNSSCLLVEQYQIQKNLLRNLQSIEIGVQKSKSDYQGLKSEILQLKCILQDSNTLLRNLYFDQIKGGNGIRNQC